MSTYSSGKEVNTLPPLATVGFRSTRAASRPLPPDALPETHLPEEHTHLENPSPSYERTSPCRQTHTERPFDRRQQVRRGVLCIKARPARCQPACQLRRHRRKTFHYRPRP